MFRSLFGENNEEKLDEGELAQFSNLASSVESEGDVKYNSLSEYIQKWGQLFVTDPKGMGLTTPIQLLESSEEADGEDVVSCSGVRLVFKSLDTGYMSKKEESNTGYKRKKEENKEDSGSGKTKEKEKKEGGVQVTVEKLSFGEVRVKAKRCDFDENTMIKEMSEETIITELRKAIDIWRKDSK
jgi:hypothetical protein